MRKRLALWVWALAVQRHQDAGPGATQMACPPIDGPGRIRCEVEARAGDGESIASGDVVLVRTPPFVTALRGRIGPHEATARGPKEWRWALALGAQSIGRGTVEARVRLVVCRDARCEPREMAVAAQVVVGE